MNISFIKQDNNRHLILIMAGWGMDATPFTGLGYPGYDIAVTWDYTNESIDTTRFDNYREIIVLAWSMGVMEADRVIPGLGLPVSLAIAVNGTVTPVSDTTGIPVPVFNGTLNTLSEGTLTRFNKRMCGSADALRRFNMTAPTRTIESLREELKILGDRAAAANGCQSIKWDLAVIGRKDMIFSASNQSAAWSGTPTMYIEDPHLPDFQAIINKFVINKGRVATRFGNSRDTYSHSATLQHSVAQSLADKLTDISAGRTAQYDRAIEIGAGNGTLTALYAPQLKIDRLELWDLTMPSADKGYEDAIGIADDAEARLFELDNDSIDLIVSASTLQWFNSPCNAMRQIERALRPKGIAALTLYTSGTYASLTREIGVSINYVSPDRLITSLSKRCKILYFKTENLLERFENTRQLIDHMRLTGVNAAGASSTSTLRRLLNDNTLNQLEYNPTTIIFQKI